MTDDVHSDNPDLDDQRLEVRIIPCLSDNYTYLVRDSESGAVAVIDPGEAQPVQAKLQSAGWQLDYILLTHHHADHVDGVEALRSPGVEVVGGAPDRHRLPRLDTALSPGDRWQFGTRPVEVLDVSGHTVGHIAFWFPGDGILFSGDSLFVMGCGRIFEGTPAQMWDSLSRIAALPPETKVYCGHEYSASNAEFCESVAKGHQSTRMRAAEIRALRDADVETVPTTVSQELATNVFLRAGDNEVAAAVGLPGAPASKVFAALRSRKDNA